MNIDPYARRAPAYVTSPHYRVNLGGHVWRTDKYERIRRRLMDEDGARAGDFIEPEPATEDEVLSTHGADYLARCAGGTLSPLDIARLELPWSRQLLDASLRCVRGTVEAARLALARGAGLHLGGGFHHAFADHGEGFCVFNDIACAVRAVQAENRGASVVVADCDVHQGNGTAAIFRDDPAVATYSIHQEDLYPGAKPPSDVDVGLLSGAGSEHYLDALTSSLPPLLSSRSPELVVYVAGADPYVGDRLGSLRLSIGALQQRDKLLVQWCREAGAAVLLVLAGGYAVDVEDTVAIHLNSVRSVRALWR